MKITIWFIIGFIFAVIVVSCLLINPKDSSPTGFPKSEYTKCIEAAQDRSCEIAILERQGYDDGIDCIMDYDRYSVCDDIDRYNAGVDASNDCLGTKPNIIDCMELIG